MNSPWAFLGSPFRDPSWAWKLIPQALILLVPVVGWIATAGWLMLAYENAVNGREELPPAGLHLVRGFPIWIVFIIYWAVIYGIPIGLLYKFGQQVPWGHLACNRGGCVQVGSPWAENFYPWSFFAILIVNFLTPSLIVNTHQAGIVGGLDVRQVWRLASTKTAQWFLAGLGSCGAAIIGGWGIFFCCIGLVFTLVYANAVQAVLAAWMAKASPTAVLQPRL